MTKKRSMLFIGVIIIGIIVFGMIGFKIWWNHNIGADIPMPVYPGDTIPDSQDVRGGRMIELAEEPGKEALDTALLMLKSADPKAFLEIGTEEDARYTLEFYDWNSINELTFDGEASIPTGKPLETDYYCHIDEDTVLRVFYSFTDEGTLIEIKKIVVEKNEMDEDGNYTIDIAEIG